MRRQKRRKRLSEVTLKRLLKEQSQVSNASDRVERARRHWVAVRKAKWFREVVNALKSIVGNGEPCMYCDSNESAEVEHLKPIRAFPDKTFDWENLLWVCGICNRFKGGQYPPNTQEGAEILNPLEVDPWKYMFIEELTGFLTGVWRHESNSCDERAESTISIVNLNREALQERRRQRINELKSFARDATRQIDAKLKNPKDIRATVNEFRASANHPDVADYFLAGPGRSVEPFKSLFERIR